MTNYEILAKRKARVKIFREFLQSVFAFAAMLSIMAMALEANESLLNEQADEFGFPLDEEADFEGNSEYPLIPGEEGEAGTPEVQGKNAEGAGGPEGSENGEDSEPNPNRNEEANINNRATEEETDRKVRKGKPKD